MDALIAGERHPRTLAGLAKGLARKKTDRLDFLSSTISTTLKTEYDLNGATLKLWTPRDTALGDDGRMPTLVEPAIVVDVWSSTDQPSIPAVPPALRRISVSSRKIRSKNVSAIRATMCCSTGSAFAVSTRIAVTCHL